MTTAIGTDRGFTLTRTINAPRDLVFRAWTDPDHMGWYLNDSQPRPAEPIEVDLRVGGTWRVMMVINADTRYYTGGLYLEVEVPERLVFAWGATDGWPKLDHDHVDDCPIVTVVLEADGDLTTMTLDVRMPDAMSDERAAEWLATPHMRLGWADTIDRLVAGYADGGRAIIDR